MEDNKNLENQDTNTNTVEGNEGTGNVDTQTTNQNEEQASGKTFTQEELNKIVQERLEKEKKKIPSKEELKAFKDWKESQKTEDEKQAEKETEYQKTLTRNAELENENKAFKAGVNKDDVDYVVFKVSKMDGDFEENLASFLEDNPKYLASNKEETTKTIDLGGEHKETNTPDLSKMSYEEYKAYRKNK